MTEDWRAKLDLLKIDSTIWNDAAVEEVTMVATMIGVADPPEDVATAAEAAVQREVADESAVIALILTTAVQALVRGEAAAHRRMTTAEEVAAVVVAAVEAAVAVRVAVGVEVLKSTEKEEMRTVLEVEAVGGKDYFEVD